MATSVSNLSSLITIDDFLNRVDGRFVQDYCQDNNIRDGLASVRTAGTPANLLIMKLLQGASGELEGACLVGGKYHPIDLATTLQGNSKEYMLDILAGLGIGRMLRRRVRVGQALPEAVTEARELLKALREGESIFALQENMDAGDPSASPFDQNYINQRQPATATSMRRFFGLRTNEMAIPFRSSSPAS
jgi:hypothetical protein